MRDSRRVQDVIKEEYPNQDDQLGWCIGMAFAILNRQGYSVESIKATLCKGVDDMARSIKARTVKPEVVYERAKQ